MKCLKSRPWCMSIFFLALKGLSGRRAEEDEVLLFLELALFLDGLGIRTKMMLHALVLSTLIDLYSFPIIQISCHVSTCWQ